MASPSATCRCTKLALLAGVVGGALLVGAPRARADGPGPATARQAPRTSGTARDTRLAKGPEVNCTVRSIHGLQSAGGIDKRLASLKKQLSKPPFSAYKSLKLLEAKQLTLAQGGTKKATLPTGKILKLTFKEKLLQRKNKVRLRMHLSITPPKKTSYLPGTLFTIANGGTLLVAGDKHEDGTLVVGITCKTK